jgi:hypothetical protein
VQGGGERVRARRQAEEGVEEEQRARGVVPQQLEDGVGHGSRERGRGGEEGRRQGTLRCGSERGGRVVQDKSGDLARLRGRRRARRRRHRGSCVRRKLGEKKGCVLQDFRRRLWPWFVPVGCSGPEETGRGKAQRTAG